MCLMLCALLDWQYAELPSSASDAVLCSVLVRKMGTSKQIEGKKRRKKISKSSSTNLQAAKKSLYLYILCNTI